MSSLKMTFSLTSLIFLIALGLVFVPTSVMAHTVEVTPATDPVTYVSGHDTADNAHPLVKSITLLGDAADGYVGDDSFVVEVVFEAANTANKISAPVLADVVLTSTPTGAAFTAVETNKINTTTYRIRLDATSSAITGTEETLTVTAGTNNVFTPDAASAMATYDNVAPTVTGGRSQPMAGKSFPLNNELTEAFDVVFTLTDDIDAASPPTAGMVDGTTFMLEADPDTVTFSAMRSLGNNMYAATVTPKAVTTTETAATPVTITATVMDMAGNTNTGTVAVTLAPREAGAGPSPPPDTGPATVTPQALTVPAKSYVIVVKATGTSVGLPAAANLPRNLTAGSSATTIAAWASMPDLEALFYEGGTLLLTTVKATKLDRDNKADTADEEAKERDVLITEVMAAVNEAQVGTANYATHQWIELYNNLPVPVGVTLTAKRGVPAPDAAGTEVRLDRLSNVAIAGTSNGWAFTGLGANGLVDTVEPETVDQTPNKPFVSFYRKDRGKAAHDKTAWMTSDRVYFSDASGVHIGTPGAIERTANIAIKPTNIPSTPFVINEVSTKGDWIELKNVDTAERSLKNYQLSQVTAADTDTRLVSFHDKDYKVPAGGVILIVSGPANSDIPLASMLANGVNVATPAGDRDKQGSPALYWMPGFFDIKPGESLLILRDNHEDKHLKTANQIVDVTGGISLTKDQSLVWPIVRTTKPHDKVIDGGKGFADGKVYHRAKAGMASFDEAAWNKSGFTGLGYKRKVTNEEQYAGSPGFVDNGAKENNADLAANLDGSDAGVTISEIMFDTGAERQNLPQWIELYNSSMTQSVKLDGWKLALENYADETIPVFNATITFEGGKIIPPNQTILLVSGARGFVPDPQRYLPTRVINLYLTKNYREALNLTNRNDQVLSKIGFHLELFDKGGASVDEVGNIDGNRRTRDTETTWDLPSNGEDRRSSIIRIYAGVNFDGTGMRGTLKKNEAFDGLVAEGWSLASETNFGKVNAPAYYGDSDDYGTPGFRAGGALPVSLSKFRPERLKDTGEIVVRWITESELNNAGFNILRSDKRDGEFTKVHFRAGQGTTSERTVYEWKDTTAKPNVVYYYQIQDVSLDGEVTTLRTTHLRGNVTAAGKLTTTWGEIKALQ